MKMPECVLKKKTNRCEFCQEHLFVLVLDKNMNSFAEKLPCHFLQEIFVGRFFTFYWAWKLCLGNSASTIELINNGLWGSLSKEIFLHENQSTFRDNKIFLQPLIFADKFSICLCFRRCPIIFTFKWFWVRQWPQ